MQFTTTIATLCFVFAVAFGAPPRPSVKVIDGHNVFDHRFPYQVSIQSGLFGNQHACGGTIISPQWVVTAAHCVGISLLVSRVVAGAYNLSNVEHNEDVQIRNIDLYNVVKHPDYKDMANDIALLKMTKPFEFNDKVQPLPISRVPCVASDERTTFSGWGSQSNFNQVLQTANMTIVPYENCSAIFKAVYGENIVVQNDIHICVTGTASPCLLDGGAPLVQDHRLIGLLTWLPATCLDTETPAIFTNTGYFKNFIKSHVDDIE